MEYYIRHSRKHPRSGPFTLDELKKEKIHRTTLVWYKGLDEWTKAEEVLELLDIIEQDASEAHEIIHFNPRTEKHTYLFGDLTTTVSHRHLPPSILYLLVFILCIAGLGIVMRHFQFI